MYVTGSDAWNSQKRMSEGQESGAKGPARSAAGFTRAGAGRQPRRGAVLGPKTAISCIGSPEPFAYSAGAPILMAHDRPFPVPEHLCGPAGELFRPGGADPGGRPPADQAEPAAGRPARPRSGPAVDSPEGAEILAGKRAARRRRPDRDGLCRPPVRAFRAAARRRPRHPARRGHRRRRRPPRHPAQGLAARRRSRAAATAAPRSARCCANTSSARRCSRWAFRPRARSPPSSPASACSARPCCPARC